MTIIGRIIGFFTKKKPKKVKKCSYMIKEQQKRDRTRAKRKSKQKLSKK